MVTSGKLILAMTTVSLLTSSIFSTAEAGDFHIRGTNPPWMTADRQVGGNDLKPRPGVVNPIRPNRPLLPGNAGRPGNGGNVTIINNHQHHHNHGAIAAAAIGGLALGAIAVAAASHQDECRYPVYSRRGRVIGYHWASCDYYD